MRHLLASFRRAFVVSAVALCAVTCAASAQTAADKYPDKPIKIIVPFAPGGSADILSRLFGQKLTEAWGQPVLIETRPGAATMIGTAAAARSDPDGYTLVTVVSNHATNPTLAATMSYDALKDFEPITLLARAPIVPYTNPSFAPTKLAELIALAKSKPGTINFGSAGPGSMTHLVAEMLKIQTGIEMTHVVYRGGAPAMNDVLAGQIPMTFATVAQALAQYEAGKMRALGVSSATRQTALPDVPTFREQGFDLVAAEWYALLAPANTPKPIITKLNAEMRRILAIPDLGDRMKGIELASSSPEETAAYIASEIERWRPIIKRLGLKAE